MKSIALRAIFLYQRMRSGRISPCRYYPSCSQYAYEAVGSFGIIKGFALATKRVVRCNPIGGSGYDPVPEPKTKKVV